MQRFLGALIVLLFCCSFAAAQGDDENLAAVKDFKKFFRKFKEEAQQVEAVMTLRGKECVPAVEELLKLLEHKVPGVRQTALKVLSEYKKQASFQPWIDELPTLDSKEQATLIKVFGAAALSGAKPAILAVASDDKTNGSVRYEALRALQHLGAADVAPVVGPMLQDGDPLVRMAAADAVGSLVLKELGEQLVPLLNDAEWQVQTAAVTACGIVRPQAAVQPLIDLMRQAGRLRTECSEALFRITGFEFGLDPDRWQEQWNHLMEIEGWRIPTDEELAKKAESRAKYNELYGQKDGLNTFAGIPTSSTYVMFIIDVSGSMDDQVVEREKFQGYRDLKKFTVVKAQLLSAIESLTQDTYFNIVAFASDLDPWRKQLVSANIINREAAKSWVERLAPIGGTEDQELAAAGLMLTDLAKGKTNTLKALMYPFGIDPDNPPKVAFTGGGKVSIKNKLDTVYFLSDGRPSVGKMIDTLEILSEVRRYNEYFKIVFHTIAIGEFQKNFLRDLALQNSGVFIDLGR
ncbi:MAG: HEAT repeat domain-containing protein [Planctomycetota bacterium]